MTAKQAIINECRWCNNSLEFRGCVSESCELNNIEIRSSVKRIKAHCLTCVPSQSYQGVESCDGQVANFDDGRICPLHPFRFGKNPNRKPRKPQKLSEAFLKARQALLSQNKHW